MLSKEELDSSVDIKNMGERIKKEYKKRKHEFLIMLKTHIRIHNIKIKSLENFIANDLTAKKFGL